MANIVEGGLNPDLPISELEEIGCQTAVYQLIFLATSVEAMKLDLDHIKTDSRQEAVMMGFSESRNRIGFDEYHTESSRYETSYRKSWFKGVAILARGNGVCVLAFMDAKG